MPVILPPSELDCWLDSSLRDPGQLTRLYQPYPAQLLQEWQVGTVVNSAAHESAETILPVQEHP